ncbi:MAG: carbamoyltransferase HypF [Planctomycetota bacterium]|jgi:hydrogenase maturation protein HypF
MTSDSATTATLKRTWRVTGQVQGVGFRPFVYRLANELELAGTVRNDPSGVTIEAEGPPGRLNEFQRRVRTDAPALARVDNVRSVCEERGSGAGLAFEIIESDHRPARRGRVTVDSAVCADCLGEMLDPADRRHRHALINCTNCGPRFTIVRDLPYDRSLTTMAGFPMCATCEREYRDPGDRRFHAQPTCCPSCGPRPALIGRDGRAGDGDPIERAARLLGNGGVIAVKGLGGYHLVVDAGREEAVSRLRRGKRRDHKPFAIMVRDPGSAGRLVTLSKEAEALLRSPICPIVLAPRVDRAFGRDPGPGAEISVAESVAPDCHRLGLMRPYTPIQHLLFSEPDLARRALVMTSANFSDDPLINDDDEARQRLADVCDAFLVHDRPIERAVDDSIVIDAPGGILPLRRARGYVPTPSPLPVEAPRPGVCVGADLKNTVAIVGGDHAVLSQHLGDLGYVLAFQRFERSIADLERLYDVQPQWIACDAHPQYLSHRYARRLAESAKLDLIIVQHHHAHLASILAEQGRSDRIIGLICDGVGYGDDGAAWGGEVLVGDLIGYERLGRLRPLRLPGGDAAARQTGRCALSWLCDTLGPDGVDHPLARRALPHDAHRTGVRRLLERDLNCPPSSGMGRLFDAAASLLGLCDYNHYEAMSGTILEASASTASSRPSGAGVLEIATSADRLPFFELDQRPLLRRLVESIGEGSSTGSIAWFFHDALADGLARAAALASKRSGIRTVGLSGGVFCNTLLTQLVAARLEAAKFDVLIHRQVPPNDGGIAYGQAAVAAASPAARNQ